MDTVTAAPGGRGTPALRVDLANPTPAYEQIRAQIAELIITGELPGNTRLPPIRQLAADLGLAGGTIVRAYSELEQAGLVHGHGRRGTVIRPQPGRDAIAQQRHHDLTVAARRFATTAHATGFDHDTILAAARTALTRTTAPRTAIDT